MPNFAAFKVIGRPTNPYTARSGPDAYPRIVERFELLQKLVRAFQDGGVRLLIGTDAMNTGVVPGFSARDELAELMEAGLTPFQALRAATANAAEFLAAGDRGGVVAAGQNADLLLLGANPMPARSQGTCSRLSRRCSRRRGTAAAGPPRPHAPPRERPGRRPPTAPSGAPPAAARGAIGPTAPPGRAGPGVAGPPGRDQQGAAADFHERIGAGGGQRRSPELGVPRRRRAHTTRW